MNLIIKATAYVLSAILIFFSSVFHVNIGNKVYYKVDCEKQGNVIPNIVDNVNVWDMGTMFYDAVANEENNIFDFVKYVQLMQCTGGNVQRDLFKNPLDNATKTDYDFDRLIKNCAGILKLGAKPHLKLGSVPLKLSAGSCISTDFSTNIYPPEDYNEYYTYIKAIIEALVKEFGADEVRSWRFGCMTEYENEDWFMAPSGNKEDSCIAYLKLYDYTVQALTDVLGENICVGAHCIGSADTAQSWDETRLLKHVAQETNYANGKVGTKISFLAISFYDIAPGNYSANTRPDEAINYFRSVAQGYGLKDLFYGVDEGRILLGIEGKQINSRMVGYTWQAAYDARLYKKVIDCGADYFSNWYYFSNGLMYGNPTITYHFARNIAKFEKSKKLDVKSSLIKTQDGVESDCLAGFDEETGTLRLMTYNYKNDLNYNCGMNVKFDIDVPQFDKNEVEITKYLLNDDCNWFDEWVEDRKTYNITDECFSWSPQDPYVESYTTLYNENARKIYFDNLKEKYKECSKLEAVTTTAKVKNGRLVINEKLDASNVVFYEIKMK